MTNREIIDAVDQTHVDVYARLPVAFVRGEGARLWDADGKEYLDLFCGLAVTSLGHCPPNVVAAIREQTERLLHVSNVFYTEPLAHLGTLLTEQTFADRVFFTNSGAEANEAAIKLARRFGDREGRNRYEILTTTGSFHGRTLATVTATGQEKHHSGFQPLLPGFRHVPFGDLAAMREAVREETVAILVEPIQGEGGVNVPPEGYLRGLRELCDEHGILLILDEVQTGIGRTGRLFAHEHEGIRPDILTTAKALGGGLPIGAMLATEDVATAFGRSSHGSTFGGNPVACAAGAAVLEALRDGKLLRHCETQSRRIVERLEDLARRLPMIRNVRGRGFLLGVELDRPGRPFVLAALDKGLLINCAADKVIRLLPPLVITEEQVDRGMSILEEVLLDGAS